MRDPFRLIQELNARDGQLVNFDSLLDEICAVCKADSAWIMMYDVDDRRNVEASAWRFPEGAHTWRSAEGMHAWQLWLDLAVSLGACELMRTERVERAAVMSVLGDFFEVFDIIQSLGFALKIDGQEAVGLAMFRRDRDGAFSLDAGNYCRVLMETIRRFAIRNHVRRTTSNPYAPDEPSLKMFELRLAERGFKLPRRVVEVCWLFYLGLSPKQMPDELEAKTDGDPLELRTVNAYLAQARARFDVRDQRALMKLLVRLVHSPFPEKV